MPPPGAGVPAWARRVTTKGAAAIPRPNPRTCRRENIFDFIGKSSFATAGEGFSVRQGFGYLGRMRRASLEKRKSRSRLGSARAGLRPESPRPASSAGRVTCRELPRRRAGPCRPATRGRATPGGKPARPARASGAATSPGVRVEYRAPRTGLSRGKGGEGNAVKRMRPAPRGTGRVPVESKADGRRSRGYFFTPCITAVYAACMASCSQAMSPPRHMKRQPRPIHFLAVSLS
jgi:hypothetical protein